MCPRISIYKWVRPLDGPSVHRSVGPSVSLSHTIFEKFDISTKMEQNSIKNMKICHLHDNSETNTRADRQKESDARTSPFFCHFYGWLALDSWFHVYFFSISKQVRGMNASVREHKCESTQV